MWSICLLYICIVLDLAIGVVVWKASMPDWLGGSIYFLYICIVLDLVVDASSMQGIYAWLTGVHLPSIYMHCTRSSSGCSGMQGIYAQLTGGSICLLYIYIVLDLVVDVVVCKASSSGCSGMQGISAQLTGGSICLLYICTCTISSSGCNVCMQICWIDGGPCCASIYDCRVLGPAVGPAVCKASVLNGLRGLDLALDVVVWKASVVSWQGV